MHNTQENILEISWKKSVSSLSIYIFFAQYFSYCSLGK